jgi:hypothetical protein
VIIGNLTAACCFLLGLVTLSPLFAAVGVTTFAAVMWLDIVQERVSKFDLLLQQIGGLRRELAAIRVALVEKEPVQVTREMSPDEVTAAAYLMDDDDVN